MGYGCLAALSLTPQPRPTGRKTQKIRRFIAQPLTGCGCTGVVTVNNTAGTASYNAEYYVLGHASKFVKPGAVRIDSSTFGSGNIEDVTFQNPDGSDALIVLNADTSSARTFNIDENGQYFTCCPRLTDR